MPATDYNDLPKYKQDKRLEMLGESVGISRNDYSQWDPESTSRGYGKKGDYDDFEKDVISAINNDYDYRTAMLHSDGAPKAVNKASEALDVYRLMKKAHKDQGHTGEFSSANDLGNAAHHIAYQHFDTFNKQPKQDKKKKEDAKLAAPTEPVKTVLSKEAAEANAFVDAHNSMTLGNVEPLQGMAVSNKAGTSSPEAADFKQNFQLKLGGKGTPLTFTEAITGTKPTAATSLLDRFSSEIKKQLEPK